MTTLQEAARKALEAWQTACYGTQNHNKNMLIAMTDLNAALEQVQPSGERGIIADLKRTVKSLQNEEDGGWTPDAHSHLLRLATSINMLAADAPKCEPVAWLYFHSRCEEQLSVQLEEPDIVKSFDADVVWKKPLYTHAEPAHGWKHAGQMPPDDDTMREAANALAPWLSASLDDDNACKEYKDAVSAWFNAAMPAAPSTGERNE